MTRVPEANTLSIVSIVSNDRITGEKKRPVYIIRTNGITFQCFAITTKFHNKSKAIQSGYLEILDWEFAGLHQPSWINFYGRYSLPVEKVSTTYIGELSDNDTMRFEEFIRKNKIKL